MLDDQEQNETAVNKAERVDTALTYTTNAGPKGEYRKLRACADVCAAYVLVPVLCYVLLLSVFGRAALPVWLQQPTNTSTNATANATVDGTVFGLYAVVVIGVLAGAAAQLMHLPPLLGMLCAGLLLRNMPGLPIAGVINPRVSGGLRKLAFVVILIEGGLGLDVAALSKLKWACIRLAGIPCIVEAFTVAFTAMLIFKFSFINGLLLGFSLGAVSPAICVPSMLSLTRKQLGVSKGIPTLVIAASSVDDVLAITAFSVLISIAFGNSDNVGSVVGMTALELFVGVAYGCGAGCLLAAVPSSHTTLGHPAAVRFGLLLLACAVCMFGSAAVSLEGAGALGCLLAAFLANMAWSRQQDSFTSSVRAAVSFVWQAAGEPLLFGLIGAELSLSSLEPSVLLNALLLVLCGCALRTAAAFMAVAGAGFNARERLFVSLAWLPKATVQAALAPVFYDTAVQAGLPEHVQQTGITMMSVAVLSILLTAPLGMLLMALTAPLLLTRGHNDEPEGQLMLNMAAQPNNGTETRAVVLQHSDAQLLNADDTDVR